MINLWNKKLNFIMLILLGSIFFSNIIITILYCYDLVTGNFVRIITSICNQITLIYFIIDVICLPYTDYAKFNYKHILEIQKHHIAGMGLCITNSLHTLKIFGQVSTLQCILSYTIPISLETTNVIIKVY